MKLPAISKEDLASAVTPKDPREWATLEVMETSFYTIHYRPAAWPDMLDDPDWRPSLATDIETLEGCGLCVYDFEEVGEVVFGESRVTVTNKGDLSELTDDEYLWTNHG